MTPRRPPGHRLYPLGYPFPHRFDAARYPRAYLGVPHEEDEVVESVLIRLRALGCDVDHVDAGVKRLRAVLRQRGKGGLPAVGVRGLSDIVGCDHRGRAIFLEVKRPPVIEFRLGGHMKVVRKGGVPTDDQLHFLMRKFQKGAIAGVTWGFHDLDDLLRPWPLDGV